jgi:hypothetical protein
MLLPLGYRGRGFVLCSFLSPQPFNLTLEEKEDIVFLPPPPYAPTPEGKELIVVTHFARWVGGLRREQRA